MKTVYMVFNNKEKFSVSSSLTANLKYVFEDYIKVKTCFLDEMDQNDIADGDLFIVLYEERVYLMNDYISTLDKVIVLSRTVQKKFLPDIWSIPEGARVLVVNDSRESTLQTANTLYELGFNHIELVPYEKKLEDERYYREIDIAITPNEALMVPKFIKNVIDIGDRFIDLNTFVTIINKLELNNERVTRNLIKYTEQIAAANMGINQKYFTDHLKSEMLKKVIHNSPEAVLLTDQNYMLVYANNKARTIFDFDGESVGGRKDIRLSFQAGSFNLEGEETSGNKLFSANGTHYIINKNAIKILDQVVGYSIILNDEQDIKNKDNDLNKQLVKTGLMAKYTFDQILCRSENMKKCISLAKKAALTDFTVLVNGESGTGKELLAQSIHNYSHRKKNAFVAINCAALPESLLESELFGYEKGAFTGASGNGKLGLFEQANRGTIFLDEIGDMSLNLQARLLRVLQEKQIMRLGSDKLIDIDIRIIAATNKNLQDEVKKKNFREDLFYRLCNIPITLPPLRQRRDDILYIFQTFLGHNYERLTKQDIQMLESYEWPGNVRQLKNVADYYQTLGEFPPALYNKEFSGSDPKDKVMQMILTIVKDHTEEHCGIGRTAIIMELLKKEMHLSDDKTRRYLNQLEKMGFLTVGKGRVGCRITRRGREELGN